MHSLALSGVTYAADDYEVTHGSDCVNVCVRMRGMPENILFYYHHLLYVLSTPRHSTVCTKF